MKPNLPRSFASLTLACAVAVCTVTGCVREVPIDDAEIDATDQQLTVAPFEPAALGCSMAHCDPQMSDQIGLQAPSGPVTTLWQDNGSWNRREPSGSSIGLGCSSNGTVAACTYGGLADNLVVYRADGSIVYRKRELGPFAWTSGPMVDEDGGVITADGLNIYRYGPTGQRYWKTPTPGGFPISPVMTENGLVVLATKLGPLSTYRTTDGTQLDELDLGFDTENTPGVQGDRIYVSTSQGNAGKLAAVDVSAAGVMTDAWQDGAFFYEPPSGASPAVKGDRIFFDGNIDGAPYVFCVRDDGDHATEMWRYPMAGNVTASIALDPRGGVWTYAVNNSELIRLSESDGSVLQTVNLNALVGGWLTYSPSSVMSIAGDAAEPVMILTARGNGSTKSYVAAVDLASGTLRWKEPILPWTDTTAAQFPIVLDANDQPIVVVATWFGGAHGIGAP